MYLRGLALRVPRRCAAVAELARAPSELLSSVLAIDVPCLCREPRAQFQHGREVHGFAGMPLGYAAQDRMTGSDVSKMRASHSARYTSTTTLQSSTGYSRVWTEGVLCLILAGLVDPQDGSARPLSTRSARSQPLAELTIPFFPTRQASNRCSQI